MRAGRIIEQPLPVGEVCRCLESGGKSVLEAMLALRYFIACEFCFFLNVYF
jgi:hypothetical protein